MSRNTCLCSSCPTKNERLISFYTIPLSWIEKSLGMVFCVCEDVPTEDLHVNQ